MKDKLRVLDSGDIEATMVYPEVDVDVALKKGKVVIGKQKEYQIVNVIDKVNVPILFEYLKEQKVLLLDRIASAVDVIEQAKQLGNEKMVESLANIDSKKVNNKRLKSLNEAIERAKMAKEAEKHLQMLQPNVDRIDRQIKFIEQKFGLKQD